MTPTGRHTRWRTGRRGGREAGKAVHGDLGGVANGAGGAAAHHGAQHALYARTPMAWIAAPPCRSHTRALADPHSSRAYL